jgi:hypothetical protein
MSEKYSNGSYKGVSKKQQSFVYSYLANHDKSYYARYNFDQLTGNLAVSFGGAMMEEYTIILSRGGKVLFHLSEWEIKCLINSYTK